MSRSKIIQNSTELPHLSTVSQSNHPVLKWLATILAVALVVSGIGLMYFNNRLTDLSSRIDKQNKEITQLQNDNARLSETLRALNATLILTQKNPLIEASLNNLLATKVEANNTMKWMWILDSEVARSVDIPSTILSTDIRLVSREDVRFMAAKTNGISLYSIDEVGLRNSTHGLVKFSQWTVYDEAGVPSVYAAERTIYYLERRAGSWIITGSQISIEDYFRAIPLIQ